MEYSRSHISSKPVYYSVTPEKALRRDIIPVDQWRGVGRDVDLPAFLAPSGLGP